MFCYMFCYKKNLIIPKELGLLKKNSIINISISFSSVNSDMIN